MLSDVIMQQVSSGDTAISTKLRDAILKEWVDTRVQYPATLVKQKDTWKEFWLYASTTDRWCPRMSAIQALYPRVNDVVTAEGLWNMGQGNAYHRLFQHDILPSLGSAFLGAWKREIDLPGAGEGCKRIIRSGYTCDSEFCDEEMREVVRGWGPKPERKKGDSGGDWQYEEAKVRLLDYRMVVKLDGILHGGVEHGAEVLELKSEKSTARDSLDPVMGGSARQKHVEQVHVGMLATGLQRARIVYIFKGEQSLRQSLMEHVIERDEIIIDRLKGLASECVAAVRLCDEMKAEAKDKDIFDSPEKKMEWLDATFKRDTECPMKSKGKAKYCSSRDVCFPKGYRKKK